MNPIDPTSLDQARDTLRKHLPLEVVREQLAAVEEELAQRDRMDTDLLASAYVRIAELERELRDRPFIESAEVRAVREAASKIGAFTINPFKADADDKPLATALMALLERKPPASAPSDDMRAQLAERTRQVAQLQDEMCDARYARDKAQSELAALKAELAVTRESAPAHARSEREVDAELRAAISNHAHWADPTNWNNDAAKRAASSLNAWLAAPLSAPDEYTRAAVAWAEEAASGRSLAALNITAEAFLALYLARHSAAASAPDGEKAAFAFNASDWTPGKARAFNEMTASEVRAMMNAAPAPADGERVTVYVKQYAGGGAYGFYEQDDVDREPARGDMRWLAIDARVVREGGAS